VSPGKPSCSHEGFVRFKDGAAYRDGQTVRAMLLPVQATTVECRHVSIACTKHTTRLSDAPAAASLTHQGRVPAKCGAD
jgi:hypothetical protein